MIDNTGHLIEAALAHYHLTGSRQFLDVMIRVCLFLPSSNLIEVLSPNANSSPYSALTLSQTPVPYTLAMIRDRSLITSP